MTVETAMWWYRAIASLVAGVVALAMAFRIFSYQGGAGGNYLATSIVIYGIAKLIRTGGDLIVIYGLANLFGQQLHVVGLTLETFSVLVFGSYIFGWFRTGGLSLPPPK